MVQPVRLNLGWDACWHTVSQLPAGAGFCPSAVRMLGASTSHSLQLRCFVECFVGLVFGFPNLTHELQSFSWGSKCIYGHGSKLNRRGKPQVLVHVSTCQGNSFWHRFFEPQPYIYILFYQRPDPGSKSLGTNWAIWVLPERKQKKTKKTSVSESLMCWIFT